MPINNFGPTADFADFAPRLSAAAPELFALLDRFAELGLETWQDEAGNAIAKIPGRDSSRSLTITGHKDEIGAIVKTVGRDGTVEVRKLGGSYPWIYGEGVVDLLGDRETVSGILSFGSRHVSHESPQKAQQGRAPLKWENAL